MFHLSNGKISAYQWDLDLFLILEDCTINEVHFSNKTMSEALVVDVHMDDKNNCIAAIPNKLLQNPYDIQAYIWIDKYTKIDYTIPIQKRPKPANYVYTETEIKRWETLAERIEEQIDISTSLNKQTATLVQEAEEQIAKSEQLVKETEDFLENSAEIMKELQVAENHERRITQLEHHISDDYFITTDDKNIPTNACPYIEVNTIGGITTQKFKTAYIKSLKYTGEQSITVYGVNITIKEDKTIEVKGSYDETAEHEHFSLRMDDLPLGPCEFYLNCKGEPCNASFFVDIMHYEYWGEDEENLIDSTNQCTVAEYLQRHKEYLEPFISAPNHDAGIQFDIYFDQCVNGEYINFTIKPMLVNTSICDGLVDNKITALKSTGANLLPFPYVDYDKGIMDIGYTLFESGITFIVNADRSIAVDGIATDDVYLALAPEEIGLIYDYYTTSIYDINGNWNYDISNSLQILGWDGLTPENPVVKLTRPQFFTIGIPKGANINNIRFQIMVNRGTSAVPYVPYTSEPIDIIQIPEEFQPTGKGVEGAYDYVDLANGKRITKCKTITLGNFTTVENWNIGNYNIANDIALIYTRTFNDYNATLKEKALCSHLPYTTNNTNNTVGIHIGDDDDKQLRIKVSGKIVGITAEDSTTTIRNKILSWLNDNNVILTYATAQSNVEDIDTSVIDNIMRVQAGGRIETINAQDEDLPISYTYLAKEGTI